MKVLVIGGAGFIGSHLVDGLRARGYETRVFDNLDPQVHGEGKRRPAYLPADIELILGEVGDRDALRQAIVGVEAIFYQAAAVGVGQSMYEIRRYVEVNSLGAATLLDILANEHHRVRKVIVASSMCVYGEGAYECLACGRVHPQRRSGEQLANQGWEMRCPLCGAVAKAALSSEDQPLHSTSIYAITKRDQEEMFLTVGRAYDIPTVALRYFNVYGRRQALSNPYTGVAAIFCSRFLNGQGPVIFEDGQQSRDFVHVGDIVQANLLALEKEEANYEVFNVGTQKVTTVLQLAGLLGQHLGCDQPPIVANQYRQGDIRHCFADTAKIRGRLGYEPRMSMDQGVGELVEWVRTQVSRDLFARAQKEMIQKRLIR